MAKYDNLSSANILAQNATCERDRLVVDLFTEMRQQISYLELQVNEFGQWRDNADTTALRLAQLEVRLDKLSDLTVGDQLGQSPPGRLQDRAEALAHDVFGIAQMVGDRIGKDPVEDLLNDTMQGSLHRIGHSLSEGVAL